MRGLRHLVFICLLCGCKDHPAAGSTTALPALPAVPTLNYSVVRVYPHDTTSYTEGLLVHDHQLFESSGAPSDYPQTRSVVGIDDLKSGKLDKKVELDRRVYFGEGIAFFKDKLYQLTYKNHVGFIYDARTFRRLDSFRFQNNEGWALTTDGVSLIMSDGTSTLTYLDPATLKPVKMLAITKSGVPLDSLNELEYIDKYIYANRYLTNYIFKIDPNTGQVVAKLDLTSLVEAEKNRSQGVDVLNGIAYDPDGDKIYVTGKLWAGIYQIAFSH